MKNKIRFLLIGSFLSALFFLACYRINISSPRVDVASLSADYVLDHGPVLLEGGTIITNAHGQTEYHLSFYWEGDGYLYHPRVIELSVNGIPLQRGNVYRGDLYELPVSSNNMYDVCIVTSNQFTSAYQTTLYLGTFAQINDFIITSVEYNYYVQGLCFAVTIFSFFLYFWKRSEHYLIWLAFLAFTVGSYRRLEEILNLFFWIPQLEIFSNSNFYRIVSETLVAILQYKVLQKLIPTKIRNRSVFPVILFASLPSFFLYSYPLLFVISISLFYAVIYICFLFCFLQLPDDMSLERNIYLLAWILTTATRFFDLSCELGIVPSGDIDLRLRFRGIISVIYVIAFFLLACKRFAQKFQEADDLNVHLEEEIRKKSLQQTTFIRSMLHNLKTPLFSLSGYSDMAMKTIDTNPVMAKQYVKRTHEKAIYAGHMMDQIFFVTQMESGLVKFQQVPLNLTDILRSVIETSQIEADKKQILLTLKAPEIMTTSGDPLYLQQAFQNIIDNALVHTQENGQVLVMGVKEKNRWRLLFTDSGCGIAPEELKKIFKAYYSNRPDNVQSSGLGLYITKEIITHHQGTITVESLPDSGTTFVILLPQTEDTVYGADDNQ